MCPVCIATAVLIAGGAASTGGGLAALAMKKLGALTVTNVTVQKAPILVCSEIFDQRLNVEATTSSTRRTTIPRTTMSDAPKGHIPTPVPAVTKIAIG